MSSAPLDKMGFVLFGCLMQWSPPSLSVSMFDHRLGNAFYTIKVENALIQRPQQSRESDVPWQEQVM